MEMKFILIGMILLGIFLMSKQVYAFPCAASTWKCRNLTIVNGTNANYTNFYTKINITSLTFSNTNELQIFNDSCNNVSFVVAQARDVLSNTTTSIYTGFEPNYTNNTGVSNVWSACYNYTGAGAPPSTSDSQLVGSNTWVNNSYVALSFNTGKTYSDSFDPMYYRPFSNTTSLQITHANFGDWGHQILDWVGDGTMTSNNNYTQMKNFTTTHIDADKLTTTAVCEIYANNKCIKCNETATIITTGGTNAFMWALMYTINSAKTDLTFAYRNGTGNMIEITANAGDTVVEWDGKIYQIYNETGSWSKTMMFMDANYTIANNALYTGYTGYYGNEVGGVYPANYTAGKTYTHTRLYCLNAQNWTQTDLDTEYKRWDNPLTITVGTEQTAPAGGDTCTYASGNWNINIADKCNITTATNVTGNVFIYGNGTTGYCLFSSLNFTKFYVFSNASGIIAVTKGSVFKSWKG